MPFVLRWFGSKTVRQAVAVRRHVNRLLRAQSDLLTEPAMRAVEEACEKLGRAVREGQGRAVLRTEMTNVEAAANKWLKPYPHPGWRENIEVLLVAIAVAMGIRTFFLQPFKIPTGSMQPTLYGVTSENLLHRPEVAIPTGLARVRDWFRGISYLDIRSKADGPLEVVGNPVRLLIFNIKQTLVIGGVRHTIWFPPDYGGEKQGLAVRAGLEFGRVYRRGEQVVRLKVQSGDHLFVDRLTYNFRKPKRGEIVVFQTAGIFAPGPLGQNLMPQDQFYIKRLVALGGERVQIGNDRHLIINGRRLDASTPHFENVYSFDPREPPAESRYSGHANELVGRQVGRYGLAPLFPDQDAVQQLKPDQYMVMGDNTLNSFDSRNWGGFPANNVIGKSFFVYWPITERFGWGHR
ncbi:MAG: signal peptidase I [Verrucomicrobiae bacterium]|nr:signal peptidase I [Verrucomicrobiae bacterium]